MAFDEPVWKAGANRHGSAHRWLLLLCCGLWDCSEASSWFKVISHELFEGCAYFFMSQAALWQSFCIHLIPPPRPNSCLFYCGTAWSDGHYHWGAPSPFSSPFSSSSYFNVFNSSSNKTRNLLAWAHNLALCIWDLSKSGPQCSPSITQQLSELFSVIISVALSQNQNWPTRHRKGKLCVSKPTRFRPKPSITIGRHDLLSHFVSKHALWFLLTWLLINGHKGGSECFFYAAQRRISTSTNNSGLRYIVC